MGLKTKITVALLVIATVLSGVYCFIATFYAPFFFRDSFLIVTHVAKSSADDLWKYDLPRSTSLLKTDRRGNSSYAATPEDKTQLQKMLQEGWKIIPSCRYSFFPIWVSKDGKPSFPEAYSS